jgi:hypothetical protein
VTGLAWLLVGVLAVALGYVWLRVMPRRTQAARVELVRAAVNAWGEE